ncbi:hypothetical protein M422DRAFT_48100 [Sphaerobolus stellatus SS14]|uniref:Unplaced genomic scaffold SPHSTscaffold_53, whole genome shotgun sequence n=1 Tax=Sphaerobolus stellatus (strain SS14) TaxID=990650 RepID=A0A0C9V6M6_SPHS4|nr:hypothetical protein M422DRAFT_48100 [Sphaerobolus stellatus SS14]
MCFAAPERTVGPCLRRKLHDVYVVRMQSGRDRNAAYLARQWYYLQKCARQAEDDESVGWWNGWRCLVCKLHNEVIEKIRDNNISLEEHKLSTLRTWLHGNARVTFYGIFQCGASARLQEINDAVILPSQGFKELEEKTTVESVV